MALRLAILFVASCGVAPAFGADRPWEVGLRRATLGDRICGGAIVNARFVVTSAGCVDNLDADDLRVRLSDKVEALRDVVPALDNARQREDKATAWEGDHLVKQIHVHPDYDEATGEYDIAILEMENKIVFVDDEVSVVLSLRKVRV